MIISTLVLLKASHGQSIRRDLFTGLRERLDDIQSRPGTVFSFLGGKEREGSVFNMFLETVQIHSSQSWLNAQDFIISADVSPSIHLHQQPHHIMLLPDLLCDVNRTEATVPLQPSVTHLQGHSHHTLPQSAYVSSSPMWENITNCQNTATTGKLTDDAEKPQRRRTRSKTEHAKKAMVTKNTGPGRGCVPRAGVTGKNGVFHFISFSLIKI